MSPTVYESLNAAAKGLLGEATAIANKCGKQFAVCGGWSPVLRNSTRISHPGTRDVDLLFSEGVEKAALKDVVSAFLDNGYLVSAKHEFQVLRVLPVGNREFVFNVDLLHPMEGDAKEELFVDHLLLPIPSDDFKSTFVFVKSIALPNAGFIFDGFVAKESVDFVMPDGSNKTQEVPIIDEVALLVTKSKSCLMQKRPRDIFDIYLALSNPRNPVEFRNQLKRLRHRHEGPFASIECINEGLNKREAWGAPSVFKECGVSYEKAAEEVRAFIKSLGFSSGKVLPDELRVPTKPL